jgi:hypothetical protein
VNLSKRIVFPQEYFHLVWAENGVMLENFKVTQLNLKAAQAIHRWRIDLVLTIPASQQACIPAL